MKEIHNIYYTPNHSDEQRLHLYIPESDEFSVFVYFHGGGLEAGSYANAENFAGYLAENNVAVASVDYRMYPYAHYPDFICDCASAVAWVFENISTYGRCNKIFAGGSSAGGYISMMLCFDKRYLAPFKLSPLNLTGFIHDAGQPTTHFNVLRERGIDPRRCIIDEAAPLYHVGTESEYPPMKFIVSDNDMPARIEQTKLMVRTLSHFEYDNSKYEITVVENSEHCQYLNEKNSEGISLFGEFVLDFVKKF